ncbi:MAG: biopolymer transporter ExbD [Nitrospirae bacterium]|nr:biopolymer transporter ExbD [Nitrospirota bacterium]
MTLEVDPKDRRYLSEINVVPLVDVVLVLLIIFMITAPLLYRGIDIALPASTSNTIQPTERLVVTVEKNGRIFLDKERVSADNLVAAFNSVRARKPDVSVYLRADEGVPYGVVVQVMDAVKRSGISQLGMVTEPLRDRR